MSEREKSQIRDYVIRRCMEEYGFTPPKNQIRLLECSGDDIKIAGKRIYIPDYVMFAIGFHQYQIGDNYFMKYEEDI